MVAVQGSAWLRRAAVVALLVAAVTTFAPRAPAADDPLGFVRSRVALSQTVPQLLAGSFLVEIKCAEDCLMQTRILIGPEDAKELGFRNVKPGLYFEIGRVQRELEGGTWTKVPMRLTAEAKARIAKSPTALRIAGQVVARSQTSGRYGRSQWIRTCRLPAG